MKTGVALGFLLIAGRAWAIGPSANAVSLTCEEALQKKSPPSVRSVELRIPNDSSIRYELFWMDFHGHPKSYGYLAPHATHTMNTYVGHVWTLNDETGKCVAAFAAAEPATQSSSTPIVWKNQESGGITYVFASTVSPIALERAKFIVENMLADLPGVRVSMKKVGFKVEIIPKDLVLSDLPDYAALKGKRTRDGRDFDTGTRGLGGGDMCSIGEENLLCLPVQSYRQEDVLIHEFSHSIKDHLPREQSVAIDAAFDGASSHSLYPTGIYMIRDSQEYWAEGTQVWFEATRRSDVNGGFNTPAALRGHDPKLFDALQRVYGKAQVEKAKGCAY